MAVIVVSRAVLQAAFASLRKVHFARLLSVDREYFRIYMDILLRKAFRGRAKMGRKGMRSREVEGWRLGRAICPNLADSVWTQAPEDWRCRLQSAPRLTPCWLMSDNGPLRPIDYPHYALDKRHRGQKAH
jgi:hypothetical protein